MKAGKLDLFAIYKWNAIMGIINLLRGILMKICMITSTPFPPEDGIGYHVYNLSKKLMEKGHDITLITRGSLRNIENSNFEGIKIIKVFYVPIYPFHVNIHGFFVNRLLNKIGINFDIIHVHTPLSPVIKTFLPVVNTIHSSITEDMRHMEIVNLNSLIMILQGKFSSYRLIKNLIQNSTVTTTVSNSMVQELKNDYKFHNAYIVSNGVDHKKLLPLFEKNKNRYILYVGRMSYRKGLFELIDAAQHIVKKYGVKFIIVGKGEWETIIKRKVKENELENDIIFTGHVNREELITLYQHADIFVMPSRYESGPLTVLEAMSCGKPVIATAVGIVTEVIENMHNGIIVQPNSPHELEKSIAMLLVDEQLKEKLGTNARATVEKEYTWDVVADNVENCYQKAMCIKSSRLIVKLGDE